MTGKRTCLYSYRKRGRTGKRIFENYLAEEGRPRPLGLSCSKELEDKKKKVFTEDFERAGLSEREKLRRRDLWPARNPPRNPRIGSQRNRPLSRGEQHGDSKALYWGASRNRSAGGRRRTVVGGKEEIALYQRLAHR